MPGSFRFPLTVSVVLNVFLLGTLVGGIVWLQVDKPRPGFLQAASNQLPQPERDALRQALRSVRRDARQTRLEARQARLDAADLLRQPTLDKAELSAALERARTADVSIRTKLEQRIVEFAAASTPEIRRLLAEALLPPGQRAKNSR